MVGDGRAGGFWWLLASERLKGRVSPDWKGGFQQSFEMKKGVTRFLVSFSGYKSPKKARGKGDVLVRRRTG